MLDKEQIKRIFTEVLTSEFNLIEFLLIEDSTTVTVRGLFSRTGTEKKKWFNYRCKKDELDYFGADEVFRLQAKRVLKILRDDPVKTESPLT